MTDHRVYPDASVYVYDEGQGDPVVTDRGFSWLDILQQSVQYGTVGADAAGFQQLEFVEMPGPGGKPLGALVCAPQVVRKDTRLSQYTLTGGGWDEARPGTGSPRVYRLMQASGTAGVRYSATSKFSLPQNPSVAFVLALPDTPADWDAAALPPYVQIEFGQGKWALYWSKQAGYLLRKVDGTWQVATELPRTSKSGYQDSGEFVVYLRCLRGRVGVSTDDGNSYAWATNQDYSPITVAAAPLTLSGQGGAVQFGLWQIVYAAGHYDSPTRNTFTSRMEATPSFQSRKYLPAGTSIAFADRSTPASGIAGYRVTLTPKASVGSPFTFYSTPELYSVTFQYPVVTGGGLGTYATPWDGYTLGATITKPYELAGGTCTLRVRKSAFADLTGNYRRRKVRVWLGATVDTGGYSRANVFTGYIRTVRVTRAQFGEDLLEITLENAAARFRRSEWSPLDIVALGGLTVNQAMDYVLQSEGLDSSYRAWHANGDAMVLPEGLAEDPCELLRCREKKWETLVRLASFALLEVGVLDNGAFASVPRGTLSGNSWSYSAQGTALLDATASVGVNLDYDESLTAVLVQGRAENGSSLLAWAADAAAETDPLSGRFAPWRELSQDEVSGTCSSGMLSARCQCLALEGLALKLEPEVQVPVNLGLSRRDVIPLYACADLGIPNAANHVILTLSHEYDASRTLATLRTTAGLRRL